mmetsp:Transcript_40672/g.84664  ORF Transcript_40672/g.84664 Transcript_40672/m.84664 type:complete len:211 (-) Transcript_40672:325-957(-)
MFVDEIGQVAILEFGRYEEVGLFELLRCLEFRRHFNSNGIGQRRTLQLLHLRSHGGGKKESLSFRRNIVQDFNQLFFKIHGQHAIGFIQDEISNLSQMKALGILQVIQQSSGRGNQNMRMTRQGNGLGRAIHASHNTCRGGANALSQPLHHSVDLKGQLSRGGQNERRRGTERILEESLQNGQTKGTRFPRPRFGQANNVATLFQCHGEY